MSIDLAYDDGQMAITDALGQFCRDRCDSDAVKANAGSFPRALWSELAELGVLAAATAEGDGGALEVAAAMEALGDAVFPGPLVATFFAGQLLDETERADLVELVEGRAVVSLGAPPLMPWAPVAAIFLELDGARVFRAQPVGEIAAVETLGGEPWGRVALERQEELTAPGRAFHLADIALAAYLSAAGLRLVRDAALHARTRTQFGRAIGEFQAVAHPLADCHMRLSASATLARSAAFAFDAGDEAACARDCAGAALSARAAALEAAHTGHQVFGAIGITLEGPAFHVTRRIRQLASQPPGPARARAALLSHFGVSEVKK